MKTSLMKIKEKLESKANDPMCIQIESDIFKRVSSLIDLYLPKEKQQIIDAATHGANFDKSPYASAHEYYEKTYEQSN